MPDSEVQKLAERVRAARVDIALQNVLDFIHQHAVTNDFYMGYSLVEALQDRIDTIGSLEESKNVFGRQTTEGKSGLLTRTRSGRPTKQAELLALEESGLAAIKEAKDLAEVEIASVEDGGDPIPVGEGNFFV